MNVRELGMTDSRLVKLGWGDRVLIPGVRQEYDVRVNDFHGSFLGVM